MTYEQNDRLCEILFPAKQTVGVLSKGKHVTVLGDSMISGIKRREFNCNTEEILSWKFLEEQPVKIC